MSNFNFKVVNGDRNYKKWSEWSIGDYVIGEYQDSFTDIYGKIGYAVKVIILDVC